MLHVHGFPPQKRSTTFSSRRFPAVTSQIAGEPWRPAPYLYKPGVFGDKGM
jgi:hypothetical protein